MYDSPGTCVHADVNTTGLSPPLPRGAGCGGKVLHCTINKTAAGCYDDSSVRGLGMVVSFQWKNPEFLLKNPEFRSGILFFDWKMLILQ